MLIKSIRDEMMLEFFNYLDQPLSKMINSMIQKEQHMMKIGLWKFRKEERETSTINIIT